MGLNFGTSSQHLHCRVLTKSLYAGCGVETETATNDRSEAEFTKGEPTGRLRFSRGRQF